MNQTDSLTHKNMLIFGIIILWCPVNIILFNPKCFCLSEKKNLKSKSEFSTFFNFLGILKFITTFFWQLKTRLFHISMIIGWVNYVKIYWKLCSYMSDFLSELYKTVKIQKCVIFQLLQKPLKFSDTHNQDKPFRIR